MHVQNCCFAYKTYCFLTFSLPSASLDLKVPIIGQHLHGEHTEQRRQEQPYRRTPREGLKDSDT